MKEWAESFYKSNAWKTCRDEYAKSCGHLCESCLKRGIIAPGAIVHHKLHLTPENINDPSVTLNWDNLELVCRDCHAERHNKTQKRYRIAKDGKVMIV